MKNRNPDGLVYSSDFGRACPECSQPIDQCRCKQRTSQSAQSSPFKDGIIRVERQTKKRAGQTVTVIRGASLPSSELKALAQSLRKACASGGTVKDGNIEIQGDHAELLIKELQNLGFSAKRSGG
ncbi:MAG: translation initiation factor Sui1 [Bdellovibrionota bacterium]|jgi:translation initiation factor 1